MIGLVITPHTVGARVQLTNKQILLWGKEETEYKPKPEVEEEVLISQDKGSKAYETIRAMGLTDMDTTAKRVSTHKHVKSWSKHKKDKRKDKRSKGEVDDLFGLDSEQKTDKKKKDKKKKEKKKEITVEEPEEESEKEDGWLAKEQDDIADNWEDLLDDEGEKEEKEETALIGQMGRFGILADNSDEGGGEGMSDEECDGKKEQDKVDGDPTAWDIVESDISATKHNCDTASMTSTGAIANIAAPSDTSNAENTLQKKKPNNDETENRMDAKSDLGTSCRLMQNADFSQAIENEAAVEIEVEEEEELQKSCDRFRPTWGVGSQAHLTLGYASNWSAVQTGRDLMDVLECEESMVDTMDHLPIDGAAIRYYGQGRCVVYFDNPVILTTLFSGKY